MLNLTDWLVHVAGGCCDGEPTKRKKVLVWSPSPKYTKYTEAEMHRVTVCDWYFLKVAIELYMYLMYAAGSTRTTCRLRYKYTCTPSFEWREIREWWFMIEPGSSFFRSFIGRRIRSRSRLSICRIYGLFGSWCRRVVWQICGIGDMKFGVCEGLSLGV